MIPLAIEEGVAVVPYSPLASGFLTGKHPKDAPREGSKILLRDKARSNRSLTDRYFQGPKIKVVERLGEISKKSGHSMVSLALHWVMAQPGVTSPIFGARTEDQLKGTLEAWRSTPNAEAMAEVKVVADEFAANSPMDYPPPPSPL